MSEHDRSQPYDPEQPGPQGEPHGGPPPYGAHSYPPPGQSAPGPQQNESAGAGVRLGARLIDGLLVGLVGLVLQYALIVPIFGELYVVNGSAVEVNYGPIMISGLLNLALAYAYFIYLDTSRGQTLGKMMLGLRVVGPEGGHPTPEQSFRRNIFYMLNLLALIPLTSINVIMGLVMIGVAIAIAVTISNDPRNQGWHDKFAGGTQVLRRR